MDLLWVAAYKAMYLLVSVIAPFVFTGILNTSCKTSPNYISHILFVIVQIALLGLSMLLHRKKHREQNRKQSFSLGSSSYDSDGSLMRSQGRCCRELLSQMKLADTYTNLCFLALVINVSTSRFDTQGEVLSVYIVVIAFIAMAIYIAGKMVSIVYFIWYVIRKIS